MLHWEDELIISTVLPGEAGREPEISETVLKINQQI